MRNKPSLDYIAGLFDGEGWFTISVNKRPVGCKGPAHQVHAGLALRQKEPLIELQRKFGGTVVIGAKETFKHSVSYRWRITGNNVLDFAKVIKNRLIVKFKQAELAIMFQALKQQNTNQPSSPERRNLLEKCRVKMGQLNKRGPK